MSVPSTVASLAVTNKIHTELDNVQYIQAPQHRIEGSHIALLKCNSVKWAKYWHA